MCKRVLAFGLFLRRCVSWAHPPLFFVGSQCVSVDTCALLLMLLRLRLRGTETLSIINPQVIRQLFLTMYYDLIGLGYCIGFCLLPV